jgi:outer membrane protein OmpA-like peptidoglycan-associated protein
MLNGLIRGTKPLLVAVALLGLSACAGIQLENARGLSPVGSFKQSLYKEYLALAEMEFAEQDYLDSDVFAERAIAAASGAIPDPEALDARMIPASAKGSLAEARRHLMTAFDAGARGVAPMDAARAQAMFDCWMQEQEENIQPDDIAWCRDEFKMALAKIEAAVAPKPAPKAEAPAPMAPKRSFVNFTIYFDHDSDVVSPKGQATIIDAANAADEMGAKSITVSGYADRSGSAKYNMDLSKRRASNVEGLIWDMVGQGPDYIPQWFGEGKNKVITPDGVKEPKNRRVKIEIRN